MGIHKKDSLIEKISDGSDMSDAMLIALKRCNQKIQEWIDNLPSKIHCLLCGLLIEKSELLFYMEDTPQFNYDASGGSVKANRYVFGLCSKCAQELKQEEEGLAAWDSKEILLWQIDFLVESGMDVSILNSRGAAKRRIVEIEETNDAYK